MEEQLNTVETLAHILYGTREWHRREQMRNPIHHAIYSLIFEKAAPDLGPVIELCAQWPHMSKSDQTKVAYTQDEGKGIADRQTVTTFGRYVRKFYSSAIISDHELRDIAARLKPDEMRFTTDPDEIYRAVIHGPTSCMSKESEWASYDEHPYRVYCPELGWRLAVRYGPTGDVLGRCWVYGDGDCTGFVRSYKKCPRGGYSHSDEALESWLKDQGIEKVRGWHRVHAQIAIIDAGGGQLIAPYLDGESQYVDGDGYITTESDDTYECTNTNGYSNEQGGGYECSHCGAIHRQYTYENEGIHVGWHSDSWVGPCCDHNYTEVYGRNSDRYYVHGDDAVEVDGEWYHDRYLHDNDIVTITAGGYEGEYAHIDNTTYDPDTGDTWHIDDEHEDAPHNRVTEDA